MNVHSRASVEMVAVPTPLAASLVDVLRDLNWQQTVENVKVGLLVIQLN